MSFTHFSRRILGKEPNVPLFRFIFTISTKGNSDLTYTLSSADKEVKAKFKDLFSKMHDWKAHFVIIRRLIMYYSFDDALLIWVSPLIEGSSKITGVKNFALGRLLKKKVASRSLYL